MKKLTDKQKIKSYEKQLDKITSLAIFYYTSQKVSSQFFEPNEFKNSDLHTIVTSFQSIMKYLEEDFKKIAIACGLDDKEIEKISERLLDKFKDDPKYPSKK